MKTMFAVNTLLVKNPFAFRQRLSPLSFWSVQRYLAWPAGWAPLALLVWVAMVMTVAYGDLPVFYRDLFPADVARQWPFDFWSNVVLVAKYAALKLAMFLFFGLMFAVFLNDAGRKSQALDYVTPWAFFFTGALSSCFSSWDAHFLVFSFTYILLQGSMLGGLLEREPRSADWRSDETEGVIFYSIFWFLSWVVIGIYFFFSDSDVWPFWRWAGRLGILLVIGLALVFYGFWFLEKPFKTDKKQHRVAYLKSKTTAALQGLGLLLHFSLALLGFGLILYFLDALAITTFGKVYGWIGPLWLLLYLRIPQWILSVVYIMIGGNFYRKIDPCAILPIPGLSWRLRALAAADPRQAIVAGAYLVEKRPLLKKTGWDLFNAGLQRLPENDAWKHKVSYFLHRQQKIPTG